MRKTAPYVQPTSISTEGSTTLKAILKAAAICLLFAACNRQQGDPAQTQLATQASIQTPTATTTPAVATGEAFKTPLPQGVILQPPFNARMDVAVENPNKPAGRRTDYEYLEGDASQAMAKFASSMEAAGFVSLKGPIVDQRVIRQVFRKPGYGTVFARAQEQDAAHHKHPMARGFVVVAWPAATGMDPAASK
jgi:hypothetical protein